MNDITNCFVYKTLKESNFNVWKRIKGREIWKICLFVCLFIAHGERSKPCAYQTFTDSKCGRGWGYLPTRLRSHGRMLARYHFWRLANQKPGFSHMTGHHHRSFLLDPPNFLHRHHKLCNFCARLNHFLGVYGKNEDYHLLRFFMLFVVDYFVFSVDAFFM